MVFVKKKSFLMFSFYSKWTKKSVFSRFQKKRSLFRRNKHLFKKPPKYAFFQRGLVHGFCKKKWRFFILYFLFKMDQGKVFCEGFERKEAYLDHKVIGTKRHQNLHFFKEVSPQFLSKNGRFLIFSFYAKWIKKKCFVKVPKEKKPFQTIKTSAQKTTLICIFSKDLVHGFGQKMVIFASLVFMRS